MAKQLIGIGSTANDGTGDNLREGATKVNNVFNELYTALGDGTSISSGTFVTTAAAQTVTNKNLTAATNTFPTLSIKDDASTIDVVNLGETITFEGGSGITTTVTDNKITFDTDGAIVTETSTDTLTNKSIDLADNTLTGTTAQFNTAVSDGDFSTTSGSETLTNKAIDLTDNTLTGTLAEFNTAISDETVVGRATTDTLTNKSISGGTNTLSNIANGSLTNSAVTLGATSVSLGATASSASNFNITGSSSLSGTGTVDTTGSGNKLRFNFANVGSLPAAADYEGMFAYDVGANIPYVADAGGWVKLLNENGSISDLSNVGSIASITNGQVLVWNAAGGRFDPGNQGAGFSAGTDLDQAGADVQDVGYIGHRSPDDSVVNTLTVTVASKTTEHYHHGTGSSNGYVIDGHESPALTLAPGVHRFDQSDSSNSGHPLLFYSSSSKSRLISTGVTTNGTPGSSGAYTQIEVDTDTQTPLNYQCSAHAYMGHVVECIYGKQRRINNVTDKTNTGDGSDTTFTVLNGYTVDDVLVIVNGIVLTPTDDYTISTTTLTFVAAPAASAEIVIRYLG